RRTPWSRTGGQQKLFVAHGAAVGQGDGVGAWVDRRDLSAQLQLDVVIAIPGRGSDGEVTEFLLACQVLLGQRWTLVGQMLLGGKQHDVAVEVFVAQCFCSLGAGEPAADDGKGGRRCHVARAYSHGAHHPPLVHATRAASSSLSVLALRIAWPPRSLLK